MARYTKANTFYISEDTVSEAKTITLSPIPGKTYQVRNGGVGGNSLTINYGTSTIDLSDEESITLFFDGEAWIDTDASGGSPGTTWTTKSKYSIDDLVWYPATDAFYSSLTDDNKENLPTDTAFWKPEGTLSALPSDYDFAIGEVGLIAGTTGDGQIALTDTRQIVAPSAYPKLFARIGTTWGGDGITEFYLPAIQDVAPKDWVTKWTGEAEEVPLDSDGNVWTLGDYRGKLQRNDAASGGLTPFNITIAELNVNSLSPSFQYSGTLENSLFMSYLPSGAFKAAGTGDYVTTKIHVVDRWERPSYAPDGMTYVIYAGNGSMSEAFNTDLDNRVTANENKLAVMLPPHKTEWTVKYGDWASSTLEVVHGLGRNLPDLSVKLYVSPTGRDEDSLIVGTADSSDAIKLDRGFSIQNIDSNTLHLVCGLEGLSFNNEVGAQVLTYQTYYYRVVVTCNALAPLTQSNFAPVKDYVKDKTFVPPEAQGVTFPVVDGEYKVVLRSSTGDTSYTTIIQIDNSMVTNKSSWNSAYDLHYTPATGWWDTAYAPVHIYSIARKQDTTGQDRESVPITDGWVETFSAETTDNIFNLVKDDWYTGDGKYSIRCESSNNSMGKNIEVKLGLGGVYTMYTDGADYNVVLGSDGRLDRSGYTVSYPFTKIEKFTNQATLNITQVNRTVTGVPNKFSFEKCPSATKMALTANDEWLPTDAVSLNTYPSIHCPLVVAGDELLFHNSSLIDEGLLVTGLPGDRSLLPNSMMRFIADTDNHEWVLQEQGLIRFVGELSKTTALLDNTFIPVDSAIKDPFGMLVNGSIIIPEDGYYMFSGYVDTDHMDTEGDFALSIYRNGSAISGSRGKGVIFAMPVNAATDVEGVLNAVLELDKGDSLEYIVTQSEGTAADFFDSAEICITRLGSK